MAMIMDLCKYIWKKGYQFLASFEPYTNLLPERHLKNELNDIKLGMEDIAQKQTEIMSMILNMDAHIIRTISKNSQSPRSPRSNRVLAQMGSAKKLRRRFLYKLGIQPPSS